MQRWEELLIIRKLPGDTSKASEDIIPQSRSDNLGRLVGGQVRYSHIQMSVKFRFGAITSLIFNKSLLKLVPLLVQKASLTNFR